ncbi:MAG TPA: RHS repeat-associated core domain-containing protein [Noviherbaspirillum sp.]|uniref:RHS repeat-associated core domain-containing protein n=1 Tax=Noviherbaspirillum sp. TaxID=1926288 RepID=UPI002D6EFB88|nr:RHS repeat-associated core domain-containing protein [Noviherbaspirillum sp.]HYD95050.1 RHS repeat-associated core domain-containing protein [Noviherbaspirillum sp.]
MQTSLPGCSATFTHAATGGVLQQMHVDGGLQLGLADALGRPWFSCNARGFVAMPAFDAAHRPVATGIARCESAAAVTASRTLYGDSLPLEQAQALNLRGQVQQHCAQDGWSAVQGVLLSGLPSAAIRYLALDYAGSDEGMPVTDIPPLGSTVPDAGLQSQGYSTALQRHDALGRPLEAVNLLGNVLRSTYLLSGLPGTVAADGTVYLRDFTHNAKGQVLTVAKGAAMDDAADSLFTSAFRYDPRTWRTTQRYASNDAAFLAALPASGAGWIDGSNDPGRRQDMRYAFDPSGNVAAIEDAWPVIVFDAEAPVQTAYRYDALYRLLCANGFESASASPVDGTPGNKVNQAIGFAAGNLLTPYLQYYAYDDGGNITALDHYSNGALSTTRSAAMKVSTGSNRSIPASYYQSLGGTVEGTYIDESFFRQQGLFDAGGNLLRNANLSSLTWDYRNQITRASYPAPGEDGATVTEYSVHSSDGSARSRKVVKTRDAQGRLTALLTVTYLGDVEQRSSYTQSDPGISIGFDGENVSNALVQSDYRELRISLGHAQQVRIQNGTLQPTGSAVTSRYYSLGDQLDSCQAELDDQGNVSSYQAFYPYGGTAFSAANDQSSQGGLATRTRQYSGEIRDESGLIYYGFRSYLPDAVRWSNPDPSGLAGSGLNWYEMVGGNPLSFRDQLGLVKEFLIEKNADLEVIRWQHSGAARTLRVFGRAEFQGLLNQVLGMSAPRQYLFGENHIQREQTFAAVNRFVDERFISGHAMIALEGHTVDFRPSSRAANNSAGTDAARRFFSKNVVSAEPYTSFIRLTYVQQRTVTEQSNRTRDDRAFLLQRLQGYMGPRTHTFADIIAPYLFRQDRNYGNELRQLSGMRLMGQRIIEVASENRHAQRSGASVIGLAHLIPMMTSGAFEAMDRHVPDDYDLIRRLNDLHLNAIGIIPYHSAQTVSPAWRDVFGLIDFFSDHGFTVQCCEWEYHRPRESVETLKHNALRKSQMFFVVYPRRDTPQDDDQQNLRATRMAYWLQRMWG